MRTICITFVLALTLGPLSQRGIAVVPESNRKNIEAVLEFYPNYTGHLLGAAQIGYSGSYARKYKQTVAAKDLDYLQTHAKLLQWSEGDEGILTYFFVTFPGYVNPASKKHLGEYLTDLNSAVAARNFDQFKDKYQYYIQELDLWNGFNENELIFAYRDEIQELSKIWMNNYDAFREEVWPVYEDQMSRLAQALNEKFDEWNLIRRWEKLTGLEYKAPSYRVVLSLGMENGPCFKSLGYDKQWCYFGNDPKQMIHQICQQTGLRMMACLCAGQYQDYNPNTCYQVYQSMAAYFTDQIFADLGLDQKIKSRQKTDRNLYSVFDVILNINPDIRINDMYAIALDTYTRASFASLKN